MNSLRSLFFLCFILINAAIVSGQSYEEEVGFTFVKAKYLLETDRYDDAVREFNQVINENPSLENALALRAYAKYKLSAFLGTKKDILKYIELKGITPEAVSLLAKAEYQLTEFDAALQTLSTALVLIEDDPELYEFRASIYMDRDEKLKACLDWEAASRLGSSKAILAARRNCGYREEVVSNPPLVLGSKVEKADDQSGMYEEERNTNASKEEEAEIIADPEILNPPVGGQETQESGEDSSLVVQTSVLDSLMPSYEDMVPATPAVDPRLMDNTINVIEVDEDLTLEISGQGLGSRKMLKQPNILILSDEDGSVVIDVCVTRGGRVVSATFNQEVSTLNRKSLVSLAIRKAKDFWFEKSDLKEQCGELRFRIKGS
jgi:tetratricopeptide (TPR) repeat protein